MRRAPPHPKIPRFCGGCTACCTALEVEFKPGDPTLTKPAGEECPHVSEWGCTIYTTRPASCRAFECLWLQHKGTPSDRPDRAGLIFLETDNSRLAHPGKVICLEAYEGALKRTVSNLRIEEMAQEMMKPILVCYFKGAQDKGFLHPFIRGSIR